MPSQTRKPKQTWFDVSTIKLGFGLSIGSFLWNIILILIALAFFIPGFILVIRENKKEKNTETNASANANEKDNNIEKPNMTLKLVGYGLMGIGMLFGLGFGAFTFFALLANEF